MADDKGYSDASFEAEAESLSEQLVSQAKPQTEKIAKITTPNAQSEKKIALHFDVEQWTVSNVTSLILLEALDKKSQISSAGSGLVAVAGS